MCSPNLAGTQERVVLSQKIADSQGELFKQLVTMRATREGTFINDRGPRHLKNCDDKTGVTYAFWLERSSK